MTRQIQRFTRGQRTSALRPQLNQLVDTVNAFDVPPEAVGPRGTVEPFLPHKIILLEIRILNFPDKTLTCARPGQQLNPQAKQYTVYLPWTFTTVARDGVTYVYSTVNDRVADGVENQQLTPRYLVQDLIFAGEFEQGTAWRDLNIDGRQWAKVPTP